MTLDNGFLLFDPITMRASGMGPLDGRTFAVKDTIAVAGTVSGNGNPLWRETHEPAAVSSPSVTQLLSQGARLIGKTHTDELTYSLAGRNSHYGTPPNPAAPKRIPGGSSSGSASVVAAGLVDFALGSDCGGSVRVPASYCGLYGLRPTHERISMKGVLHLAPSFDTVGWFARDAATMATVGRVLIENDSVSQNANSVRWRRMGEAFAGLDRDAAAATDAALAAITWPIKEAEAVWLGDSNLDLEQFRAVFGVVQRYEAWAELGAWITAHQPRLGPGVAERFKAASKVTESEYREARERCEHICAETRSLFGDSFICLPTVPGPAPLLEANEADIEHSRALTLALTAVAGIAGMPQISLPIAQVHGAPMGLSLIGPKDSDLALLHVAESISCR